MSRAAKTAGKHDRLGRAPLDHERRELDPGEHVGGADDGAELVEQVDQRVAIPIPRVRGSSGSGPCITW